MPVLSGPGKAQLPTGLCRLGGAPAGRAAAGCAGPVLCSFLRVFEAVSYWECGSIILAILLVRWPLTWVALNLGTWTSLGGLTLCLVHDEYVRAHH